ncbi:hypothetical protein IVB22_26805 [Bradyrhizobium sp. 190]|uniref:hypothetical protein n=1 Tax=Bradyrhizobium sp. 190 TaxID=2782658 RepID=UPI001FF95444|nr:hypothetical protein [Bradyrhizobium sp. 190]MCK1516090.1 hypothetical protein [Bradyrhizobium sp. 190]
MKFDRRAMWSLILTAYWTAHAFQFRPDIDLSLIGIGFPGGVLIAMAVERFGWPVSADGVVRPRRGRHERRHSLKRIARHTPSLVQTPEVTALVMQGPFGMLLSAYTSRLGIRGVARQ